ncbi:D-3-phosphoglycerate dehydrogenase [alpha proteobacterium BAL199]|jgi:diaminopimelate decarboxylase|nr:D-3-phosphoglycerate dehydrogenase [alpha proteobacterium BAL199]
MQGFEIRDGALAVENVPLATIAEQVGTPAYVYSAGAIRTRYRALAAALDPLGIAIHYAVKANSNQAIITLLRGLGAGADVVSGGELARALAAGIPADRIVFAGVGKTRDEMAAALDAGIHLFNIESEPELETLAEVARSKGTTARVGLRVNPNVDAKTHAKITTGKAENKFGVPIERAPAFFARAGELSGVEAVGLSVHIGSQILDLEPYRQTYVRVREMALTLRAQGYGLRNLDLGGGLGIGYRGEEGPDPQGLAAIIKEQLGDLDFELAVEPGRWLVGAAGVLLARVILVKQGETKRHVVVDAAMNDLIRPTLYEGFHRIEPVVGRDRADAGMADIVGPICESGDYLAKDRPLPAVAAGELLVVRDAGAYGAVMSSTYNARPLAPEVLVDGDRWTVIRPRQSVDALIALDKVPDWLAG